MHARKRAAKTAKTKDSTATIGFEARQLTAELTKTHAESEFEKYRIVQDRLFESDFDRMTKNLPPEGDNP